MYAYINGKITSISSNSISIENNGIGFLVYVPNPYSFVMDEECKIYIYQHVREAEITLYGFKSEEDKNMFLKLIEVKGLGCKTAIPMLATGSIEGIIDAVERENILYLKKFPKIGDKVARQIILDLKGKFNYDINSKVIDDISDQLIDVLKGLGYKQADINRIIVSVNKNLTIEEQIKEALKLLLK